MNFTGMNTSPVPLLGFAAWSGSGKTTLLTRLIPLLRERGIRIALIKHAHHNFDIDHPGKDSYELRRAGAEQVLVASSRRMALMLENPVGQDQEPTLEGMVAQLNPQRADLILVEGFKHQRFPKIEIHRPTLGKPLLCVEDTSVIAVATDTPAVIPTGHRVLPLNDPTAIATYIVTDFLETS